MPGLTHHLPPPRLPEPSLFDSTSRLAGRSADRYSGVRYRAILIYLRDSGPACIWEIAAALGCFDHQISGRFGELVRATAIRRTGLRRLKPTTGCQADVYELTTIGLGILNERPSIPLQTGSEA